MTYYFDYGATSLKKPQIVIDKVMEVLSSTNYANPSRGSYREANNAFSELYKTRRKVANLFGLSDERYVIFTNNATESLNIVIKGLLDDGDHVITTKMEHNSVLRPIYQLAEERNISYSIVNSDCNGTVIYEEIENHIQENTRMMVVTHASNVTGNVVNIIKIGEICKKYNVILVVDGSQAAGVIPTCLNNSNVDVYCCTGHKSLFAPQGVGIICLANKDLDIKSYNVGGSGVNTFNHNHPSDYPARLEAGTHNTISISGLGAGIDYILEVGQQNLYKKQVAYADKFYNALKDISCLTFYGDYSSEKTAIVSFNFNGISSGDVAETLAEEYNIAVRAGSHCAPLMHKHFKTEEQGIIRFSFSSMNTDEEIDYAINAIKDIAKNLVD